MNNAGRYIPTSKDDIRFGVSRHLLKIRIVCPECGTASITEDHPDITGNLNCFKCGRKLADEFCEILWDSLPKTVRRQSNG